jgi:hypothetical protein
MDSRNGPAGLLLELTRPDGFGRRRLVDFDNGSGLLYLAPCLWSALHYPDLRFMFATTLLKISQLKKRQFHNFITLYW